MGKYSGIECDACGKDAKEEPPFASSFFEVSVKRVNDPHHQARQAYYCEGCYKNLLAKWPTLPNAYPIPHGLREI